MREIWYDIKAQFRKGNTLIKLIYINGGMYILMLLFQIIYELITNASPTESLHIFHSITGLPINNFFEFIELQNIGSQTINLAGAQFTDGISYTFPSVQLTPGRRSSSSHADVPKSRRQALRVPARGRL